jgi:hypothetical protein
MFCANDFFADADVGLFSLCVGLTFLGNLLVDDQRASNRLSTCLGLLSEVGLVVRRLPVD